MLFGKEEYKSRWILKYILLSLKHLGIGPLDEKGGYDGRGLYRMLIRFVLFMWCIQSVFSVVINQGFGENMVRRLELMKVLGCLVIHWKFAQHHEALVDLLNDLEVLRHDYSRGVQLHRISKYCVCVIWIFEVIRIPSDYAALIVEERYSKFIERDLFLDPKDLPDAMAPIVHLIAILFFAIERILISGTISVAVMIISFVNILLIYKFDRYDRLMEETLKSHNLNNPEDMLQLRLIHADLCLLIQKIDDIFCTVCFALHAISVFQLCLEVNRFFAMSSHGITTFGLYNWAFDATYATALLLILLFSAAFLCVSPTASVQTINQFGLKEHSELYEHQLELTQSQMGVENLALSAGKLYNMDRGTFITSLGIVASYVVFSMQMPELAN